MVELLRILVELKDSALALIVLLMLSPVVALVYIYVQEKKTNRLLQECINTAVAETAKTLTEVVTLLDVLVYGREKKK